jgi:hypothetical protein
MFIFIFDLTVKIGIGALILQYEQIERKGAGN